ncbi:MULTISPECIES: phosphoribosylglycinamide formyltransferase [Aeromonas]|uniref:phosphoribosylglycinamide formyltransferase 1 n=1 Tax=Aeromonas hydrophila TaxID=644 RepID=A0ABD7GAE2_AERHY|nr:MULTISPECIES: formyltransferase family protein [Aeromonas]AUZ74443.1 hypothetical protein C2U40_06260 [Aeromonas sp. ASNIH4]MCV9381985.1 formyltransferase family protein [Aeromonas hydrophila]POU33575.1 hypothetical protein C3405_20185 [Aeromonas hydrophila]POV86075.1 hypothetical protein C3395_21230 [Aeromonas sp. ASNIH6]RCF51150.1 hypothetical protein C6C11_06905 [Aeromonas hydrophila]
MKIVFICSTNGSVIKEAISTSFLSEHEIEFVSDRQCGIIDYANSNNFPAKVLNAKCGHDFSKLLVQEYSSGENVLFISFYTRLLSDVFLKAHPHRVINFHPSILPACPGMDGFGDTLKSGALFIGSTVHFIDEGMDTGKPILQAAFPRNPGESITKLRHRVFLQQVISLLQVVDWFLNNHVICENDIHIENVMFELSEFSPNISHEYMVMYQKWLCE